MPEIGEQIYYFTADSPWPGTGKYIGETSRSWLTGYEWRPTKVPKKGTTFVTKEAYEEFNWYQRNRFAIGRRVGEVATVEQIKQIAAMIGFVEERK